MTGLGRATHVCPGCGKPGIRNAIFACKPCWFRLPKDVRDEINFGWRHDPDLHAQAVGAAVEWYADHPTEVVR